MPKVRSASPGPASRRLLGESPPRRVAVVRALQLGDLLCAVPALRSLRAGLPEAEIVLVGLRWAESFAERFCAYLDDFLALPGFPGLPEEPFRPREFVDFLAAAQARRFDLALQLHGSGELTNPLTLLLGARHTAGFYAAGAFCPDEDRYIPYPADEPEPRRLLRLVEHLGLPSHGEHLELPLLEADREALGSVAAARDLPPGEYACVHVGARAATRRWPVERFAAVADGLAEMGLRVVLTGSAAEAPLTAAVAGAMRCRPLDLAGQTSFGALATLLAGARLLVCNDTGVSHVAAGLGTPSVVIFTASDPRRWAPSDSRRHRAVYQPVACRPCAYATCPVGHPCAVGVTVAQVLEQAEALLGTEQVDAA